MYGKILIQCRLVVRTGLHIGDSSVFSAIGAVDSPVVRDPLTGQPIVPGSSLKGKLRTLLARCESEDIEHLHKIEEDSEALQRLFGSSEPPRRAQLQFADAPLCTREQLGETLADQLDAIGVTEIKSENTIDRATAVANPRQIERVVAGAKFNVRIVYDIASSEENELEAIEQAQNDLKLLAKGMKLLQLDYLGGHGSRGSGRVSLEGFHLTAFDPDPDPDLLELLLDEKDGIGPFKEVERYDLFSV